MVPLAGIAVVPFSLFATIATILRVLKKSSILAVIYIVSMFTFVVGGSYII